MSINIDGSTDPFYRYKRDKLILRFNIGRKRTYITNILDIESKINRDLKLIKKYLNKKLSISVNWKNKENELELGGIYNDKDLEECLQCFINEYILCNKCGNPETKLKYNKKKDILKMKCNACGKKSCLECSEEDIYESILKIFKTELKKRS